MGPSFIVDGIDRRVKERINIYWVLSVQGALCQALFLHYHHLILARTLRGRCYQYFHFTNEGTESQRG